MHITGTLQTEIAQKYRLSKQMVHYLARRDGWRVVTLVGRTKVFASADVERTMKQREKKR